MVEILLNRLCFFLIVLICCGLQAAEPRDAVVLVDGCSGVCVDAAGLVMTAKHCDLPETVTVKFRTRTVSAQRVYSCHETEGPVVYDCEGDGYPYLEVAMTPPRVGECVWTYGYPQNSGQSRELRWTSGRLLRWNTFTYAGGPFEGNVVGCRTAPGWSGGPLLNRDDQVCGLLNSGDQQTSVFISSAAVREAYAVVSQRNSQEPTPEHEQPTLYVFSSKTCGPCLKFKQDYAENSTFRSALTATFQIKVVDVDVSPALADRYRITNVPTFLVLGQLRISGYSTPKELLQQLGIGQSDAPTPEPTTKISESSDVTEAPTGSPKSPPATTQPEPGQNDERIERLTKLVQSATTMATWLGVTGATGGAGGLVLGGIALWRTIRKRRQQQSGRAPPPTITIDSPPPPQAIVPETRFAPYERDTYAEAFAWAEAEMARKYPGSVGTLETIKGLIDQYLSSKGLKPNS